MSPFLAKHDLEIGVAASQEHDNANGPQSEKTKIKCIFTAHNVYSIL